MFCDCSVPVTDMGQFFVSRTDMSITGPGIRAHRVDPDPGPKKFNYSGLSPGLAPEIFGPDDRAH